MKQLAFPVIVTDTPPEDADNLLTQTYKKLAASDGMIAGQTEKYDGCDVTLSDGRAVSLRSYRINLAHRLFYVVVDSYFVPLEVVWNHDIHKSIFAKPAHKERRAQAAQAIAEAIIADQQASAAEAMPTATQTAAAAASSSPKKNHIFFTEEQAVLASPTHQAQVLLAPAGSGKTEVAKAKIKQWHEREQRALYFTVGFALADKVHSEIGAVSCWSLATIEDYIATHFPALKEVRKPADFDYFCSWYKRSISSPDKYRQKETTDFHQLYAEFTQVILQPSQNFSAFLSEAEYGELPASESYIPLHKRMLVYRQFHQYLSDLSSSTESYEPHLRWHTVFVALQTLKKQDKTFPFILFDALAIDEVQQVHPWLLAILLCLIKEPKAGQIFLCGDPHQNAGMQRPLVLQPIKNVFRMLAIPDFEISTLTKNFRNALHIGKLAHLLLSIEQCLWGSSERGAAFGIDTSAAVAGGDISTVHCTDAFVQQIKQSAKHMVLIPDEMDMTLAKTKFGNHMVVPVSQCGGLEWENVIFYGFDSIADQLTALGKLVAPDMLQPDAAITFARKKGEVLPSLTLRSLLQTLMTAVTRAKQSVTFLVDEGKRAPVFVEKIVQVVLPSLPVAAAAVQPPADVAVSSPGEWIAQAILYFNNGSVQLAQDTFYQTGVWGSEKHVEKAKVVFAQNDFKDLLKALQTDLQIYVSGADQIGYLRAFLLSKQPKETMPEPETPKETVVPPTSPKLTLAKPVESAKKDTQAGPVVPSALQEKDSIKLLIDSMRRVVDDWARNRKPGKENEPTVTEKLNKELALLLKSIEKLSASENKTPLLNLHALLKSSVCPEFASFELTVLGGGVDQCAVFQKNNFKILYGFLLKAGLLESAGQLLNLMKELSSIYNAINFNDNQMVIGDQVSQRLIFKLHTLIPSKNIARLSEITGESKAEFLKCSPRAAAIFVYRTLLIGGNMFRRVFLDKKFMRNGEFRSWFVKALRVSNLNLDGGALHAAYSTALAPNMKTACDRAGLDDGVQGLLEAAKEYPDIRDAMTSILTVFDDEKRWSLLHLIMLNKNKKTLELLFDLVRSNCEMASAFATVLGYKEHGTFIIPDYIAEKIPDMLEPLLMLARDKQEIQDALSGTLLLASEYEHYFTVLHYYLLIKEPKPFVIDLLAQVATPAVFQKMLLLKIPESTNSVVRGCDGCDMLEITGMIPKISFPTLLIVFNAIVARSEITKYDRTTLEDKIVTAILYRFALFLRAMPSDPESTPRRNTLFSASELLSVHKQALKIIGSAVSEREKCEQLFKLCNELEGAPLRQQMIEIGILSATGEPHPVFVTVAAPAAACAAASALPR